jgi:predicted O-methyltransferase YrrM
MLYIGDISKNDFLVIKELATNHKSILEFGVGASTQVIANFTSGKFTAIDTSHEWIELTKKNLEYLNISNTFESILYNNFVPPFDIKYDFVFNDGIDELRSPFGIYIFPYIEVGGILAYHDTRRPQDVMNVTNLINTYYNEIDLIEVNKNGSNITLIKKKKYEPYEDWNIVEEKISLTKGGSVPKGVILPPHMM